MKLKKVANEYYSSHDYKNLRDETKAHYQYCLTNALATSVDGVVIGDVDVTKMSTKQSKLAYDQWCDRGISTANHIMAVTRILFNYAVRMEHCNINPFATVRRRATQPRKVVWTKGDVKKLA